MNENIKKAGQVLHLLLNEVEDRIIPGITTKDIDDWVEYVITNYCPEVHLACKGYKGYPTGSCISVNEEIIHGVAGDRIIKEGDIVKVDIVLEYNGWFADSARSFICGKGRKEDKKLVQTCKECLYKAIKIARNGVYTGDIGHEIQLWAETHGYSVMKAYTGHGIGQYIHQEPSIPCFGKRGEGDILREGDFICIEPMLFMGSSEFIKGNDGWTISAKDMKNTAHFEHTIEITKNSPIILT